MVFFSMFASSSFASSSAERRSESPHRPSVIASWIQQSLADQTWSSARIEGAACGRLFFVASGAARFELAEGRSWDLERRQFMWTPAGERGRFRMLAGGEGAAVLVAEEATTRVAHQSPLSAHIRPMLASVQIASSTAMPGAQSDVEAIFASLVRESRDPGPGASALLDHLMGALFIHLWRLSGRHEADDVFAFDAPIAQRFRQIVEMRYRENLSVDDFAAQLGVTRAQLHAACLKGFGRPPNRLVNERRSIEARVRLRETAQSIEEIAFSLGFKDPSYFNRFFRRITGASPGEFRRSSRSSTPEVSIAFEAWP